MHKNSTNKEALTRWDALKEIMECYELRNAIGSAWPLYLYTIFHGDHKKMELVTSYPELHQKLREAIPTLKKWKERLVKQKVAVSIQGSHQWTMRLLPPYDLPLTCLKTDHVEMLIKTDNKTQKLMKKMFSSENAGLLPLIAELTHKVERLEQSNK